MTEASLSSFAARDISGRLAKAGPIIRALKDHGRPANGRRPLMLDIGTGSGVTGKAVAQGLNADFILMDTTDEAITDQSNFVVGSGEAMPFKSNTFDYIVANHVVEHVIDQTKLLREIERVLVPGGVAYMATPSKFTLLEPHYKLPFLSWMPQRLADAAVKLTRKGDGFRISPLTRGRLLAVAQEANLDAVDMTEEAIAHRAQASGAGLVTKAVGRLPRPIMRIALPVAPSHIWLLRKRDQEAQAA